jgi:hypothetical protein
MLLRNNFEGILVKRDVIKPSGQMQSPRVFTTTKSTIVSEYTIKFSTVYEALQISKLTSQEAQYLVELPRHDMTAR